MELRLHDNIQFIYELALAKLELEALGLKFQVQNDLRTFHADEFPDKELLKRRLAYFATVDGEHTDYYHLQKYNRTGSVNQYLSHWFYPYKGKFHPQMIRALLNVMGIKEGETVLDPFIGSGTTALECQLLGIKCIGIDVSPLCVLISKVKTQSVKALDEIETYKEKVTVDEELFRVPIDEITDHRVRNFFRLAEMIARSDESRRKKDFRKSFCQNAEKMFASTCDLKTAFERFNLDLVEPDIREGDARRLLLPDNSVDAIITSPPYSIALNYVQNDAHALSALGYDLKEIKDDFLGVRGPGLARFEIYWEDMSRCILEMYRVLKPGGILAMVVGNVTFHKEEVPVAETLARTCEKAGFTPLRKIDKIIFGLYNVIQKEFIYLMVKG